MALSIFKGDSRKGGNRMKKQDGNRFATNQGGVIKAPKSVKNEPHATVVKGNDLRNGKGNGKDKK